MKKVLLWLYLHVFTCCMGLINLSACPWQAFQALSLYIIGPILSNEVCWMKGCCDYGPKFFKLHHQAWMDAPMFISTKEDKHGML